MRKQNCFPSRFVSFFGRFISKAREPFVKRCAWLRAYTACQAASGANYLPKVQCQDFRSLFYQFIEPFRLAGTYSTTASDKGKLPTAIGL